MATREALQETTTTNGTLHLLLDQLLGAERTQGLLDVLVVAPELLAERPPAYGAETEHTASRALLAQALNMLLFDDLLRRVPAADAYVRRAIALGRTVFHDHGAVRTVALAGMGALPAGEEAIVRLLRPLGYALQAVYPLERLKMTGRSYAQQEMPEAIAQFFVSELHPDRFTQEFVRAVSRVTANSADPLTPEAAELLARLEGDGRLPFADALQLLPVLVACFNRQHGEPEEADYELLLTESAEMAWIATEGNAFNHVTDRVADVDTLSEEQKALGEPIKETVERSQTGRVRQTAFKAARVRRPFRIADGTLREREVPGSFLEFITRLPVGEGGPLDLGFDSSNAQAIFKMTAGS